MKKVIVETAPTQKNEIEGVSLKEIVHATLGPNPDMRGFTYCGIPNRELNWVGCTVINNFKTAQVVECPTCHAECLRRHV